MNTETLKSYKLTQNEWHVLAAIAAGHYAATNWLKESLTLDLDVLVLAGLVERGEDRPALTSEGHEAAAAIDMIFDWDDFAHVEGADSPSDGEETVFLNGEPIKRSEALEMESERPKPMTVGALVRHIPTGGVGLITKHTMYNADWGGFYVDFVKPVDNIINGRAVNKLSQIFDRGDKFERV